MPPRLIAPVATSAALLAIALVPGAAQAASGGASATTSTTPAATTTATTPATTTTAPAPAATATGRPSPTATIQLASSSKVTARKDPSRSARAGTMKNGEVTRVRCQVNAGAVTSGRYGTSKVWNRVKLKNGRTAYVPDVYMSTSSKDAMVAPYCGYPDPKPVAGVNPGQGRCNSAATVTVAPVPPTRAAFVSTAGPFAQASAAATKVPASVTLAQGILESGSGMFTAGANNYFGIKARLVSPGIYRWANATTSYAVGCIYKQTNEAEGGRSVRQIAAFRMYDGMRASFDDHGQFLVDNARYAPAFATTTPDDFVKAIARAGYATDPSYSSKLIGLIHAKALPLTPYDG